MSIDSIIFDLDGTLWNSSEGVSKTWSLVLNKYDYEKIFTHSKKQSIF